MTDSRDSSIDPAAMLAQLREMADLGFGAGYVMIGGPEPRPIVDELGAAVLPETTSW